MLLQALVACAGVTLGAVATALGIELRGGALTNCGRRPRFPGYLRRREGRARWLQAHPASHFAEHLCDRQSARETPGVDRALLRRLPDAS